MCTIDDKYYVARMIVGAKSFSVADICDALGKETNCETVFGVLGELVTMGIVVDSGTHAIGTDGKVQKIFEIPASKDEDAKSYFENLDNKRGKPDVRGKPQGFSFRVAERLLQELEKSCENFGGLDDEDNKLGEVEQYLALAQSEETSRVDDEINQNQIIEANLRYLYGRYLNLRKLHENAIVQFVKSAQLFRLNKLNQESVSSEIFACNIYMHLYSAVKRSGSATHVKDLVNLGKSSQKILQIIQQIGFEDSVIMPLIGQTVSEIGKLLNNLSRSKGDFITVINQGWSLYEKSNNPDTLNAYKLVNKARIMLMNGMRLQAYNLLADAEQMNQAGILTAKDDELVQEINSLLFALQVYQSYDNLYQSVRNGDEITPNQIDEISQYKFDEILPFYWVDILEKAKASMVLMYKAHQSITTNIVKDIEATSAATNEFAELMRSQYPERPPMLRHSLTQASPTGDSLYTDFSGWQSSPDNIHQLINEHSNTYFKPSSVKTWVGSNIVARSKHTELGDQAPYFENIHEKQLLEIQIQNTLPNDEPAPRFRIADVEENAKTNISYLQTTPASLRAIWPQ